MVAYITLLVTVPFLIDGSFKQKTDNICKAIEGPNFKVEYVEILPLEDEYLDGPMKHSVRIYCEEINNSDEALRSFINE